MVRSYWFFLPYYNPHICGLCSEMQKDFNIKLVVFDEIGSHRVGEDWKSIDFRHEYYYIFGFHDLRVIMRKIKRTDIVGSLGLTYNYLFAIAAIWAASRCDIVHVFSEGFRNFSYVRAGLISLFPWHKTKLYGIGKGAVMDYQNHSFFRKIDNFYSDFAYPFDLNYPVISDVDRMYFSTFCGQLIIRKNVESFLRFAHAVLTEKPKARFQIIGNGPEKQRLKRYCEDKGLSGHVDWRGDLTRYAVLDAFRNSQSLYLNSHYEGWGAVCLEAMACGCFLILGKNVRANVLISNSEVGIVFQNENDIRIEHIVSQLNGFHHSIYLQIQNLAKYYSSFNLYKLLKNDIFPQD